MRGEPLPTEDDTRQASMRGDKHPESFNEERFDAVCSLCGLWIPGPEGGVCTNCEVVLYRPAMLIGRVPAELHSAGEPAGPAGSHPAGPGPDGLGPDGLGPPAGPGPDGLGTACFGTWGPDGLQAQSATPTPTPTPTPSRVPATAGGAGRNLQLGNPRTA